MAFFELKNFCSRIGGKKILPTLLKWMYKNFIRIDLLTTIDFSLPSNYFSSNKKAPSQNDFETEPYETDTIYLISLFVNVTHLIQRIPS